MMKNSTPCPSVTVNYTTPRHAKITRHYCSNKLQAWTW